ncbi:hypothetical protein [Paractinoplanes durhamensis]|uniref:Uncharacterized protein n=1 Tax=Paractinoplanes durhamensis TaxID=113563 RepID=A0ABQ3YR80_9ACTN|nr:hypothetical protein [Actinoplanes durhamensis]GIE00098.1 hypothetical protein Adu01nite_14480 [Actinoplanes durhamensis]
MQDLADVSTGGEMAGNQSTPRCLHCADPLVLDDLWGWVHDSGEYLCRDRESGELLCQPATLI